MQQRRAVTVAPIGRVEIDRIHFARGWLRIGIAARPERDIAGDVAGYVSHQHRLRDAADGLFPALPALLDRQALEHCVGQQPAVGTLPGSDMQRSDRCRVGWYSSPDRHVRQHSIPALSTRLGHPIESGTNRVPLLARRPPSPRPGRWRDRSS